MYVSIFIFKFHLINKIYFLTLISLWFLHHRLFVSCQLIKKGCSKPAMADPNMENINEDEDMNVQEEGLKENDESASSEMQEVPFLTGLNLVFLVSYLSLSEDECLSLEDTEKIETAAAQEPKESMLRSQAEKRKLHEPKLVEARIQRVQTKVRDCRHNRRM